MLNIVLFGPPGAGKGTQSQKLAHQYQLIHLSTGDMLRSESKARTDLGKKAKVLMDAGQLVPDAIVIGIIRSQIERNPEAEGFIFDGFPRTLAQAHSLDQVLEANGTAISLTTALEVPEQELIQRLLARGKDSGRADDRNEQVIRGRLEVYEQETAVLKDYYRKQDKFQPVNGLGSVEEVFDRLQETIQVAKES